MAGSSQIAGTGGFLPSVGGSLSAAGSSGSSSPASAGASGSSGSATGTSCGKNEALCNGHCFATVGEEHDGCRLLIQPNAFSNNLYGAYQPAVANGKLYFLTYGTLEVVDLQTLERRIVHDSGASLVVEYGVADTFVIVSDRSGLLRVELADGKTTVLAADTRGAGFELHDDIWYFDGGNLSIMPREGGAVTDTGINVGTFAVVGDQVYSETGFSLGTDVTLTSLSNPTSAVQLAKFENSVRVVQANEKAAYWYGDGSYFTYSVADKTVSKVSLPTSAPVFATHDSLVLMKRDDTQQLVTFSVSDLELKNQKVLATIAPGDTSVIATASDTHLYLCTDHAGLFEIAR